MSIKSKEKVIAVYGLGTETERFLSENKGQYHIVGLLDGYRLEGHMYGCPIISLEDALSQRIEEVIVVARPGSCKVIAKRIADQCKANGVHVIDVRGNDLLLEKEVRLDFKGVDAYTKDGLKKAIDLAEVVSFDLFDTLVTRKVYEYTDVFDSNLRDVRLAAE